MTGNPRHAIDRAIDRAAETRRTLMNRSTNANDAASSRRVVCGGARCRATRSFQRVPFQSRPLLLLSPLLHRSLLSARFINTPRAHWELRGYVSRERREKALPHTHLHTMPRSRARARDCSWKIYGLKVSRSVQPLLGVKSARTRPDGKGNRGE